MLTVKQGKLMPNKPYKNFRGELITNCPKPAGTCSEFNHFTKAQVKKLQKDSDFISTLGATLDEDKVVKPRQPRRSDAVKGLFKSKEDLQSQIDSTNGLIYTYQQDPYNRELKKRKIAGLRRRISNLNKKMAEVDEQIQKSETVKVDIAKKKRKALAYIKKNYGRDLKAECDNGNWRSYKFEYLTRTTGHVIVTLYADDQNWSQGFVQKEIGKWKVPQKELQ